MTLIATAKMRRVDPSGQIATLLKYGYTEAQLVELELAEYVEDVDARIASDFGVDAHALPRTVVISHLTLVERLAKNLVTTIDDYATVNSEGNLASYHTALDHLRNQLQCVESSVQPDASADPEPAAYAYTRTGDEADRGT